LVRHKAILAGAHAFHLWLERTPFIVIPGLDPGISADSGGWGDPRMKSGDDDDEKPCLHHGVTPLPDLEVANRETRLATPDTAMTE
jgi:hypothetical protein